MKKWTKLMAVALSLVIIASAIAGGIVLADEPAAGGRIAPPPMQRGGMAHSANLLPELLGLTAEEIHTQRLAGASLAEIAAAQDVSEAELVAALTAGITDKINQAVTDGKLTQEQADEMLAQMEASISESVQLTDVGPRADRGSFGGRGGHMGGTGFGGRGGCGGDGATTDGTGFAPSGMMRTW